MDATTDLTDKQRLEAAVRRLPLLPERKTEVDRAVTGLVYVIRSAAASKDEVAAIAARKEAVAKENAAASIAAAAQVRDVEWALYELKEAWDRLSDKGHDAVGAHFSAGGAADNPLLALIERHAQAAGILEAAADTLEHPDRPLPAPATPSPDDPAFVLVKHAARTFTRLTGKEPPNPRAGEKIIPGAFFWFLEDIFRAAHITASVETYIRRLADS
jgi:hypothetical protein